MGPPIIKPPLEKCDIFATVKKQLVARHYVALPQDVVRHYVALTQDVVRHYVALTQDVAMSRYVALTQDVGGVAFKSQS